MASRNDTALESGSAGLGPWAVLFGTLCAAGGHGVFLLAAVWLELERAAAQDLAAMGPARFFEVLVGVGRGRLGAAAIAWLQLAPLLALASLLCRRPLMASRWLAVLALATAVVTAGAFALYLRAAVSPDLGAP